MMMVLRAGLGKSSPGRPPISGMLSTVAVSVGSRPPYLCGLLRLRTRVNGRHLKAAAMHRQTPISCRFQAKG